MVLNRFVFAASVVSASIASAVVVPYTFTGNPGSFTVPAGVTSIDVSLWGAGGGATGYTSVPGAPVFGGSAGAYLHGTVAVTPGETLIVTVGGGGAIGLPSDLRVSTAGGIGGTGGFNGGGRGGDGGTSGGIGTTGVGTGGVAAAMGGGGGGGFSGIFRGTISGSGAVAVAGGGGGGSLNGPATTPTLVAGNGSNMNGGTGGTGGSATGFSSGQPYAGGGGGGGAGGGYNGGAAGSNGAASGSSFGGSGGSGGSAGSYLVGMTNTVLSAAPSGSSAVGTADPFYVAGVGAGAPGGFGATLVPTAGAGGRIVIFYSVPEPSSLTAIGGFATFVIRRRR